MTTEASSSFRGQEVAALPRGVCLQGAFSWSSDSVPAAFLQTDNPRQPVAHAKSISHQKPFRAEGLTFICINDLHTVLALAGGGKGGGLCSQMQVEGPSYRIMCRIGSRWKEKCTTCL